MKLLGLVVVGVVGVIGVVGVGGCRSPQPVPPVMAIRHPDMLAVMERFLAAPLEAAPGDPRRITEFAVQNHDVLIVIDQVAMPFLSEDLDPEAQKLLLTGFVAGNAASQLRAGVRRDDLVAGIDGALKVYRVLKAAAATTFRGRAMRSPGLDALLDLEAKGQLRAHLERAQAARDASRAAGSSTETEVAGGDEDKELSRMAQEGMRLVQAGNAQAAITEYIDKVIVSYERRYRTETRRIYCARSPAESLMYMLEATTEGKDAIAIAPTWADAWFLKSYALTELRRPAAARAALERAIRLSPHHSHYLSELGFLHQQAGDWQRSLEIYKSAEDSVGLVSDQRVRILVHARILRGQGQALIRLGDLNAGEQKFQQALALQPDDAVSKQVLEQIRNLKQRT